MTGSAGWKRSMERKSDIVRSLVAAGDYKAALRIAKDFRLGISKKQSDDMKRGYECIVHPAFYKSLGMDVDSIVGLGIATVKSLYGT